MARPIWFVNLIKKLFPGRYTMAQLTNVPLIDRLVDQGFFAGDDIIYLPINETIKINAPLSRPADMVLPSSVLDHFIAEANYHWIMDFCLCRDSDGCQDYPVELGCLFLGEAVLGIRPEYGRLVSKSEAREHVARCAEAGLVHLVGRNKLDTIWLGVGPSENLLTICHCCPCCCLWKFLPQITPRIGDKVTRMPGVDVTVTDLCAGCGTCSEEVCFVDAIHLVDGRAKIEDACRGCGRCVEVCPSGAIELTISDEGYVRQAVDRISPLVDLS